jgi:murein DD-endopeptidase MepM/ murein hydrolase activator NlpD
MKNKKIQDLRDNKIIKRVRQIMERDGVYVTLFICFCIVSIVAIYTATENFKQYQDKGYINYQEMEDQKSEIENEVKAVDAKNDVASENIFLEEEDEENIEEVNASGELNNQNTTIITDKPTFAKPVPGKIYKEFSVDALIYSATLDRYTTHNGVDIESEMNTPVCAVLDGRIADIKEDEMMGITIFIDHGDDLITVYSNLSTKEMVEIGDLVQKGDVISGIGDTTLLEALDKPHLHFEVIKNGEYVDPVKYLGSGSN